MSDGDFLRLTEETNALDFLRKARSHLGDVKGDKWAWKWVVISLFGAIYGFAVAAASGTDLDRVTRQTKKGSSLLDHFDVVLTKCQDPKHMKMLVHSQALILSDSERDSLGRLKNDLRNNFMHMRPMGWSIELSGMPTITRDSLRVAEFLALETGTYVHLEPGEQQEVRRLVSESRDLLERL